MEIKHNHIRDALRNWANEVSQRQVAIKITEAYMQLGLQHPVLQCVEYEDGTVDYAALHNNKQQIFRWLDGDSRRALQNIQHLLPAILAALPAELRASLAAGNSVEYLATQAMKANQKMISSILLRAPLSDFDSDCAEWERVYASLQQRVRGLLH
ncbi:hypothetical protein GW590_08400 [Rahnella sp. SAP-1]|uniref:Bacterial toxin YdaT domain-containing protein n=1 Tax=Rouxiella aceris TaxID=2703884 RepID=A0A848MI81_9GAMM|nr:toxin YdaT family protein [Rouxiella aceris]NMP26883.1 hypothetical protein [Rouxiella aceris]